MSEELVRCPKCKGTGKRRITELAYENIAGVALRMARRMGATFKLNDLGEARVQQEIERLRATDTGRS